jgi:mRNA-degrading endonuclease RelE of RelBE toxin-antitoxin system
VPYRIEYSFDAEDHLRNLTTRQQVTVLDTVDKQLIDQPTVETRNRKLMRPNPLAPWELRIGNLRVYYDVEEDPEPVVYIRAVGVKERNRVRLGKEVIDL